MDRYLVRFMISSWLSLAVTRSSASRRLKVHLIVPRLCRFWLHQVMSFLTGHTFLNQFEHNTLTINQAKSRLHIAFHILREDRQILNNITKTIEHVINKDSRIRRDNPLPLTSGKYHVRARGPHSQKLSPSDRAPRARPVIFSEPMGLRL